MYHMWGRRWGSRVYR